MIVEYEDEDGETLLSVDSPGFIPNVNDNVIIDNEEWRVKSRVFYPDQGGLVISLTQTSIRNSALKEDVEGRLTEVKASILALSARQSTTEKKVRSVNEQTASIRKHINQRITQENKERKE